jgi:hypothetical protein
VKYWTEGGGGGEEEEEVLEAFSQWYQPPLEKDVYT